jgi:hypothetical protein
MPVRRLLLIGLLAASACAAPTADDEAPVDSTSDAVVGGSETFERPEVGMVWHGSGLCTGTLVRPNVVLTAMHCTGLAKDQDVSAAQPAFAFEIRKSATERHRYAVKRIHSITTGDQLDGTQHWRAFDIALLQLSEDVPAAVARPAQIARYWPRLQGPVSVYGYGCTDRVAGANGRRPGSGTKRKKDYRWTFGLAIGWADTQNVCPGDSGGPLLDLEHNAVLGTTSGYVNGDDAFGDVPRSFAAVTAQADAWSMGR